ncbi:MAG TPA: S49 family peptidase [Burkholderiaceae bacterium]|nr:S49 family peptidase [Burkholderiaceae bacterium]
MNSEENKRPDVSWERQTLEKLAFAMVEEQKAARRWRSFWRFVLLLAIGAVVWLGMAQAPSSTPTSQPHTALIDIKGEIGAEGDASAGNIIDSLRAAFEDAGAMAVILAIDSPGGSPVQAGLINDEIGRLKALHKKPVYAVVGDTCASAAYYIAASADEIYVDKASIVGSIGVLMDGFGFTGLMEKVGVERRLLTAGSNKGFLDPFSPQTDKQREHALDMLNEIHQQFITVVKNGRGDRLKETPDMFSGLFWSGAQSIKMGLADGLGSVDYVARDIVKAEEIVDYTRRENVAERLAKRFGAAFAQATVKALLSSQFVLR